MGNKFKNLALSEAIPIAVAAASRTAASQAGKYSNQSSSYKKVTQVVKSNAADASKDWLKSKANPPAKSNDTKYTPNKPASKPAPKTSSGNPPPDTTPANNDDDSGSNSTSDNAARSRFSNLAKKAREANAKTTQVAVNKIRNVAQDTVKGAKTSSQGLIKGAIRQLGSSSVNN